MKNTLRWRIKDREFEDGSKLVNWQKLESSPWHHQIDSHEMTFDIYEYDGQYWKLYQGRWVSSGTAEYVYTYGGQACRVSQVKYKTRARSPHSGLLKEAGELEWVRVYEVDDRIHSLMKTGRSDPKYDSKAIAVENNINQQKLLTLLA